MAQQVLDNRVHRLKIVLEGTRPQVQRRVEVPSVTGLWDLHMLIQVLMRWDDSHLHSFEFNGRRYSENEGFGLGPPDQDEHAARIGEVLRRKGAKGLYTYDFGDDWEHSITVEEIFDAEPDTTYPRLLGGQGGGPPEDCGGVPGFEHLRYLREHPEEITGGYHGDAEEQQGWVDLLEPDQLDLDEKRRRLRKAFGSLPLTAEAEPVQPVEGAEPARPVTLPPSEELARAAVESSPLRELLALARWFSTGRALTASGLPRPVDVRAMAAEVDLWPNASVPDADERAERLTRLRSAKDLRGFLPLWRWVEELDMVRISSKKAGTAPEIVEGPSPDLALELWGELFDAAVQGDPDPDGPFGLHHYETELFPPVLRMLYEAPDEEELPLDGLVSELIDNLVQVGGTPPEEAEAIRVQLLMTLYRGVLHLARSGAVRVNDRSKEAVVAHHSSSASALGFLLGPEVVPGMEEIDCSVALTPLGRYGVRGILLREGVPAPLSDELTKMCAADFLDSLMRVRPELHSAEITSWLADRTPEETVAEIIEAASDPGTIGSYRRALAMEVLEALGEPALPHLRAALSSGRPTMAGAAAGALLCVPDLPEEERAGLNREYGPWLAIDMVAAPLEMGDDYLEVLFALNTTEGTGPIGHLLSEGTDRLWKVDHPSTVPALEAVGRLHPDKKVAKAARRAAHKARSRG